MENQENQPTETVSGDTKQDSSTKKVVRKQVFRVNQVLNGYWVHNTKIGVLNAKKAVAIQDLKEAVKKSFAEEARTKGLPEDYFQLEYTHEDVPSYRERHNNRED